MCEVKVQALEVVAALEEVMKENNLNLELASIAPTILVSGSVLWGTFQCGIHWLPSFRPSLLLEQNGTQMCG